MKRRLKKFLGLFKRKSEAEELSFYELDDSLFSLVKENEEDSINLMKLLEISQKLLENAKMKGKEWMILYAEGILSYFKFEIKEDVSYLDTAIKKLTQLIELKEGIFHAHYFLGKAYYKKSFNSSDPLKYKALADYHFTKYRLRENKSG